MKLFYCELEKEDSQIINFFTVWYLVSGTDITVLIMLISTAGSLLQRSHNIGQLL